MTSDGSSASIARTRARASAARRLRGDALNVVGPKPVAVHDGIAGEEDRACGERGPDHDVVGGVALGRDDEEAAIAEEVVRSLERRERGLESHAMGAENGRVRERPRGGERPDASEMIVVPMRHDDDGYGLGIETGIAHLGVPAPARTARATP